MGHDIGFELHSFVEADAVVVTRIGHLFRIKVIVFLDKKWALNDRFAADGGTLFIFYHLNFIEKGITKGISELFLRSHELGFAKISIGGCFGEV